jgi:RNA polymerase sigma-70 factor (ECF subfamily)
MVEHALTAFDEIELAERARRRDPAAIRLIIGQQNRRLYRIARSISTR